ncbi:hypothetical protein LINPERPRIM_LOCUS2109 [Linum perenne]
MVNRGTRWRLGDGSRVKVWGDGWLRNDHNFYTEMAAHPGLEGIRVKELCIRGTTDWDQELIAFMFTDRDMTKIAKVSLGACGGEDTRIWHFDKKGCYTLRSAFGLYLEHMLDHRNLKVSGAWKQLWDTPAPPNFKNLVIGPHSAAHS